MPDHTEESGPVFEMQHILRLLRRGQRKVRQHARVKARAEPCRKAHRRDRLEHIAGDDEQRVPRAVGAIEIRQARVAAAVGTHIVVKKEP